MSLSRAGEIKTLIQEIGEPIIVDYVVANESVDPDDHMPWTITILGDELRSAAQRRSGQEPDLPRHTHAGTLEEGLRDLLALCASG